MEGARFSHMSDDLAISMEDGGARAAASAGMALTIGATAALLWLRQSSRRRRPAAHQALITYLHEHLSGADAALQVVEQLSAAHRRTEHGPLFARLALEFTEDRAVLLALSTELGASSWSLERTAGHTAGAALRAVAGSEAGDLALLRTLEALAIGVQGKRCLWRLLEALASDGGLIGDLRFDDMETRAVRQWELIDAERQELARNIFQVPVD